MKKYLIFAIVVIAFLFVIFLQDKRIKTLSQERDRHKENVEALSGEVEYFKVRDSLNGAKVYGLELTLKEFERFRAEDAKLINELKSKNRDLTRVNEAQYQTIIDLMAAPKDTVIIRDSVPMKAKVVHCGDEWYDFEGVLTQDEFKGKLTNKDALILAENVKYKRFLGFLWKTKKIEDRELTIVSKNPHTEILGVEHIVIEKK